MAAQAIPSYAPRQAAAHFNKLECFCFNQYTLEPGEKKQWPVAFVIDPQAVERRDHHHAVVHLLRGGRQDAAAPSRPARQRRCQPEGGLMNQSSASAPTKGSFLRTVRAVAWSLIWACARGSEYQQDLAQVNPFHIIVPASSAVFCCWCCRCRLVNWVVTR
jgi:cytochrome c oxidase assembly protein subunit 11